MPKKSSLRKSLPSKGATKKRFSKKPYRYNGHNPYGKEAYAKAGTKQKIRYIITGTKYDREELGKQYKKELKKIENRETRRNIASRLRHKPTKVGNKPLKTSVHKKKAITLAYNNYDKKYRSNDLKITNCFKLVEHAIDTCSSFVKAVRRVLPSISKVVAFVRLANDGRKLIISLVNINDSIDELIDIATTEEESLVSIGEGFKELINIIKETKDIYDAIKDVAKQAGILLA